MARFGLDAELRREADLDESVDQIFSPFVIISESASLVVKLANAIGDVFPKTGVYDLIPIGVVAAEYPRGL
jgi:hypothetical protein